MTSVKNEKAKTQGHHFLSQSSFRNGELPCTVLEHAYFPLNKSQNRHKLDSSPHFSSSDGFHDIASASTQINLQPPSQSLHITSHANRNRTSIEVFGPRSNNTKRFII